MRSPTVTRRALLSAYARGQGLLGSTMAAAWSFVAVGLVALLLAFDVAQFAYGRRGLESACLTVLVVGILWLLAIVEGSELAVARLLATDPESLGRPAAAGTLHSVQKDPKLFFNGRQALVVTSIVCMTLSMAQIANLHAARGTTPGLVGALQGWFLQAALLFGFPNFIVLWFSQLYPKLRAASDPPGRFVMTSYQVIIRFCTWLERTTRLGAPTTVLGILRDRALLTGAATEAVSMEPLAGSSSQPSGGR